jgi:ElaA protein
MEIDWRVKLFDELTLSELYDIMNLRQVVFVVEQDAPYIDADYKDQKAWHIMAYINNELAAYTRVLKPGVSYAEPSIGRVVNAPKYRNLGLGKKLMAESIKVLEEKFNTASCRISAQTYLLPFYKSFGFEVCSEEYMEDGLPHHEMVR